MTRADAYGALMALAKVATAAGDLDQASRAAALAGRLRHAGTSGDVSPGEARTVRQVLAPRRDQVRRRYPWLGYWRASVPSGSDSIPQRVRVEHARLAQRFATSRDVGAVARWLAVVDQVEGEMKTPPQWASVEGTRGVDRILRGCTEPPSGRDWQGGSVSDYRRSCGAWAKGWARLLHKDADAADQVERGAGESIRSIADQVGRLADVGRREPGEHAARDTVDFYGGPGTFDKAKERVDGAARSALLPLLLLFVASAAAGGARRYGG